MLQRTIKMLLESKMFDLVAVTTDDDEIKRLLFDIPKIETIERPHQLADDITPTQPVIQHAINLLSEKNLCPKFICCVYPCSPMLTSLDISKGLNLLLENQDKFIFPVVEFPHPIERAFAKQKDGLLQLIHPENQLKTTQSFEKRYHDAGQFYFATRDIWLSDRQIHLDCCGLELESWRMIDIDTLDDWRRAEVLCKAHFFHD